MESRTAKLAKNLTRFILGLGYIGVSHVGTMENEMETAIEGLRLGEREVKNTRRLLSSMGIGMRAWP